ncbi:hypothetical protein CPB83DRAFT_946687, partial [Crepidotus variabilis]
VNTKLQALIATPLLLGLITFVCTFASLLLAFFVYKVTSSFILFISWVVETMFSGELDYFIHAMRPPYNITVLGWGVAIFMLSTTVSIIATAFFVAMNILKAYIHVRLVENDQRPPPKKGFWRVYAQRRVDLYTPGGVGTEPAVEIGERIPIV